MARLLSILLGLALVIACDDGEDSAPTDGAVVDVGTVDATVEDGAAPFPDAAPDAGPTPAEQVERAAAALDGESIMADVKALAADRFAGRGALEPGGEAARAWLVERVTAIGLAPAGEDGFGQPFADGHNVLAVLPGRDPTLAAEHLVISAHYDHLGAACPAAGGDDLCNGAADNATGVAAALALAEAFAAAPPGRSVLFAFFDAEEQGLLGSAWFVDHPTVPLASIAVVLNLDTLGAEMLPGVEPSFALGIEYCPALRPVLEASAAATGYTVFPVSRFFDGSDEGERNDAFSFWQAEIPALFYSSGVPPEYHSPADEPAIVDPEKLLATTRHAFRTAAALAWQPTRPAFDAAAHPHLGDAEALSTLADVILADPAAVGLDDPDLVATVELLARRLHGYVDDPPETESEWTSYQGFIRTTLDLVFSQFGR